MSAHRASVRSVFAALAIAAFLVAPAFAQHMGHGSQGGQMQGTQGQMQGQMAGEQMMRNVDSMMTNIESMMRDLSAMPMAGGQHDQMITGMNGMLDQMRGVHGDLTTMMKDPQLMQHGDAMKPFNQACRNLEQMATAFQSMTKNVTQAMKGLHNAQK